MWNSPWTEKHHHTYLSRKYVTFNPNNSVTLTLPISKTDPFQRGTQIHLAPSPSSPLCPVRALKLLYNCYPRPPNHPLFSRPLAFLFQNNFSSQSFMNYSSRLVFPHSGSRVIQFEKELQLRRPRMAYLEITLNSLVDGKAMLSTSTSTNFKNRIILPNYFPSILNFTLHFPRTHLSGANESDDPYGPYPLRCLACRDLQRASVRDDARARSQQLNWIIISSPISQLGIGCLR